MTLSLSECAISRDFGAWAGTRKEMGGEITLFDREDGTYSTGSTPSPISY
jgi:hypothetical protein